MAHETSAEAEAETEDDRAQQERMRATDVSYAAEAAAVGCGNRWSGRLTFAESR